MARRVITLDEKIRKAEAAVAATKAKYDTALDELEKLVAKRKQLDDKKFLEMDPDSRIDAASARKEFGDRKPTLVDYMLWSLRFVTKSEYVDL